METLKVRTSSIDILQTLGDHRYQPRLLCPSKFSVIIDGENKTFHNNARFKQYLPRNLALQKALEGKLQSKKTPTQARDQPTIKIPKKRNAHK